jgi:hypothetical protein
MMRAETRGADPRRFRLGDEKEGAGAADATRAILRTQGLPKGAESTFAYFANSTSFSMLQAKVDSIPIA